MKKALVLLIKEKIFMKKGTSVLPLVMGLVGGILAIPSAICSGACAKSLATWGSTDSAAAATVAAVNVLMGLGITGGLFGIIGGILGKPLPIPSGILLSIGVVFLAVSSFPTMNILGIICVILVLLGAIFAFTQKKEEVSPKTETA